MIAVFDSGLGGLGALSVLQQAVKEDILYFGDTARLPYGNRDPQTLCRFAKEDIRFLLGYAPRAVLAACGTVSAVALPTLKPTCPVPLFGVVEPTAKEAIANSVGHRIGVIGTCATIACGAYRQALLEECPDATVFSVACPLFVPLIESGLFLRRDCALPICRQSLSSLFAQEIDTLILGCTHYVLLSAYFSELLPGVRLLDAGACGARALLQALPACEEEPVGAKTRYFVSEDPASFARHAKLFLGKEAAPVYLCRLKKEPLCSSS